MAQRRAAEQYNILLMNVTIAQPRNGVSAYIILKIVIIQFITPDRI